MYVSQKMKSLLNVKQIQHPMLLIDGEGNGTPLQYSCLANPMDRGAWQAAVHRVARSQTRLRDFIFLFTFMHWRRKWQPTPVFLPGESQGQGSLVGCCLWGRTELDTTEATQQQQQLLIELYSSNMGCVMCLSRGKITSGNFI